MSAKQRIPITEALGLAEEFLRLIMPYAERAQVAGSIRRQSPSVGDIEIVAIPDTTASEQVDLFGQPVGDEVDLLHRAVLGMVADADVPVEARLDKNGRPALGERYMRLLFKGRGLDLFSCKPPAQWGAHLAIRTGPHGFNVLMVTSKADGGAMPYGMYQQDGALWKGEPKRGGVIVPTPDEEAWFAAIGVPCWPPEQRTEDRLRRYLRGVEA